MQEFVLANYAVLMHDTNHNCQKVQWMTTLFGIDMDTTTHKT